MVRRDETVCFDDHFREVLHGCSLCGRTGLQMRDMVWRYLDDEAHRAFAIAMGLCQHCLRTSDYLRHVDTLCRQRYGFPLEGAPPTLIGRQ